MKKRLLKISVLIMIASIFLPYLMFFSMGFDAADFGWPNSYYHFLTFKKSLVLPILFAGAIISVALVRDQIEDSVRKYIDFGIMFMIIALIVTLSGLFFSLHALSQGGHVLSDSSMYSPLTQSITGIIVNFATKVLAIISLSVGYYKDNAMRKSDVEGSNL